MTVAVAVLAALLFSAEPLDAPPVPLWAVQAVVQLGVQEAPPPEPTVDQQTRNALLALAMGLAIFSSSLALGIAFGIRRRLDQIAGPIPDEDD